MSEITSYVSCDGIRKELWTALISADVVSVKLLRRSNLVLEDRRRLADQRVNDRGIKVTTRMKAASTTNRRITTRTKKSQQHATEAIWSQHSMSKKATKLREHIFIVNISRESTDKYRTPPIRIEITA